MYSPRHRRYATMYEVHLNGQLIVNDPTITTPDALQDAMYTKINALINAYSTNYQDFSFYHDDGQKTRHSLDSASSLTGVQVRHRSWPEGNAAEYATLRSYSIILTAMYDLGDDTEDQLFEYKEKFNYIGTTGPQWVMKDTWDGPHAQLVYPRTHQRMIQVGSAIGWAGYPEVHVNSFYPAYEHEDRRMIERDHPTRFKNGFRLYPIHWKFDHSLPTGNRGAPIPR